MEDRRFNDHEILKNHVAHGSISVIDDIEYRRIIYREIIQERFYVT